MLNGKVQQLRANMTDAERKLWRALRSRSIGPKFRRQVPLGPYVVDFVCFESKIIVEVDGGQHVDNQRDKRRDAYFEERKYRILRFWSHDVLQNIEGVLTAILDNPSPGSLRLPPSPSRGEGRAAVAHSSAETISNKSDGQGSAAGYLLPLRERVVRAKGENRVRGEAVANPGTNS